MEVVTETSSSTTMKVGFSFSKVSIARRKRDSPESEQRDYVTDISGGNRIRSLVPNKRSGPLVIPLEFQGNKRTKPAPKVIAPPPSSVSNTNPPSTAGGVEREKTIDELAIELVIKDAREEILAVESDKVLPIILQNQLEGIEDITDEDERFKFDVNSRPDEANEEAYENTPIEEFGKALLRGMGWEKGKPIGLNNRGLTEPIEFVARQGRLGLGATPETIEIKKKKYIKPGESREPKPTMVAQPGADGKVRHVKGISEKLVPLKKGLVGKLTAISSGTHEGLYARVIQELPNDEVAVRLLASEEDVVVAKSDLNLTITESMVTENHPAFKYISKEEKVYKQEEREQSSSKSSSSKSKSKSKTSSSSSSSSSSSTWLVPWITVRIVSKTFEGGKYYNKKGHIVDVVGRKECVVQLPNGSLVDNLKQKAVETVIPKIGGKVMVVSGKSKGSIGTLLERKKDKDRESGVVQLSSDLTIGVFELDDIAEYVGSPDGGDYMDL